MRNSLRHEVRLSQHLAMTPQLRLSIKMLQLARLELTEFLREEIDSNPVLEEGYGEEAVPEETVPKETRSDEETKWDEYVEDHAGEPRESYHVRKDDGEGSWIEKSHAVKPTLAEYIGWQIRMSDFTSRQVDIGIFIAGNLDEDGYLRLCGWDAGSSRRESCLEELAGMTKSSIDEAAEVLRRVQRFDPPGIAARDLRECLLIQARMKPVRSSILETVIENHLEEVALGKHRSLASSLEIPLDLVVECAREIRKLEPKPGRAFCIEETQAVVPDVYVKKVSDEYIVYLNEDGLPKLFLSPYYRGFVTNTSTGAGSTEKKYVRERIRSAIWVVKSLYHRQRTILRVVESIVRLQRDFLDKGVEYLKPLVLRDVAEDIGVHESTVSRATTNKYVHTPQGIFELKYFFPPCLFHSDGTHVSSVRIKERIKKIISTEDKTKPISDEKIAVIIRKGGMILARRTVAKYRESMGIPSSSRRRRYY